MKTIKLGTSLKFTVYDFRGQFDFPEDDNGFLYMYHELRTIQCRFTGKDIKRNERYAIRSDSGGKGWRIDRLVSYGPLEAVYGEDGQAYFDTPKAAAKGLVWAQDEIARNTSV